jgi:hypothetical protein
MRYWAVGDFHDNTTRVLGGHIEGFINAAEAQAVIDTILRQQSKPHHVSYRVAPYVSLTALCEDGVKV